MCHQVESNVATLTCRMIHDATELSALSERWRALNAGSVRPEAMLSPKWLLIWWAHYGTGRELAVGVYEADGELVGLALMCRRVVRYRPGLRFRRLEVLGGEAEEGDGVCSDYPHLLVRPGFERQVCDAFVAGVCNGDFGDWDEVIISPAAGDHPLTPFLSDAWRAVGLDLTSSTVGESPYLPLPATWDEYLKSLSKKRRQSLNYAQRDFDAWADKRAVFHKAIDAETLAEGQRALFDLHRQRWQAEGKSGVFASQRFQSFHEKCMIHLLERGQLDLTWITIEDRPVAAQYSIRYQGRLSFYQTGRIVDVPNQVRLGIVMVMAAMKAAIADGIREFDFLGGPAQYKSLFTDHARPLVELRVARRTLKESLRKAAEWSVAILRRVRARLRSRLRKSRT